MMHIAGIQVSQPANQPTNQPSLSNQATNKPTNQPTNLGGRHDHALVIVEVVLDIEKSTLGLISLLFGCLDHRKNPVVAAGAATALFLVTGAM